MLRILFLVTMSTSTSLVAGQMNFHEYPVFTSCNTTLIDIIQKYRESTEAPNNTQKRLEAVGQFVLYHTSYEGVDSDFKCNLFDAYDNHMKFTLLWKNGNEPITYEYDVIDNGKGVVTGKPVQFDDAQHRYTWYVVHSEDGLEVSYVCNDDHAKPTTALSNILVARNGLKNTTLMENAKKYKALMENWGFHFNFNSFSECFTE